MNEYLCQNCHRTWSVRPPEDECRDCGGEVVELKDTTKQITLFDSDEDEPRGDAE
jgi:rRNA maturation endonuclease Nob1